MDYRKIDGVLNIISHGCALLQIASSAVVKGIDISRNERSPKFFVSEIPSHDFC